MYPTPSTAAGLVDGVGYIGGTLAGVLLGGVAQRWGWTATFDVLALAAALAAVVATTWSLRGARGAEAEVEPDVA
jgi:sugar phosphate permease